MLPMAYLALQLHNHEQSWHTTYSSQSDTGIIAACWTFSTSYSSSSQSSKGQCFSVISFNHGSSLTAASPSSLINFAFSFALSNDSFGVHPSDAMPRSPLIRSISESTSRSDSSNAALLCTSCSLSTIGHAVVVPFALAGAIVDQFCDTRAMSI